MNKLAVVISNKTNVYENLALEKFLLENVSEGEVFLYLWQNEKSVVCGRNQNLLKECRAEILLADGGRPARRLSGGGAVFHDMGNLNFTFAACEDGYDVEKQLKVIIRACASFGINAERTGRNDIEAGGAKFSGNAFYRANPEKFPDKKGRLCHHGTLMLAVDRKNLEKYLDADREKYESRGVESVNSRVVNLSELAPGITPLSMEKAVINAFEEEYKSNAGVYEYGARKEGAPAPWAVFKELELSKEQSMQIQKGAAFFSSDEWLYMNNIKFNVRFRHRFDFGDFDLRILVKKGVIQEISLFSDSMDHEYILDMARRLAALKGNLYSEKLLKETISDDKICGGIF